MRVSHIGPDKPYRRMPAGLTGPTSGEGTGLAPGAGAGGPVVDGNGDEISVDVVGDSVSCCSLGRDEKTRALRDAPAAADAAATIARVVFDIGATESTRIGRNEDLKK